MGLTLPSKDSETGKAAGPVHDAQFLSQEYAESLDAQDPLRQFRKEFIIPTKADLKRKTLHRSIDEAESEECIYLCGNSLGLQPRRTRDRVNSFLSQWSTKAVIGHFVEHEDSRLAPFLHIDDHAARLMAPVVGALDSEVAVMGQLTANLLLLMASFYRPTKERFKIILEKKAFPSDHYAIESQIAMHGFDPKNSMVLIEPDNPEGTMSTEHILRTIDRHASDTALVLLPGVQFYTGQYFDIPAITAHTHLQGILIGWDCAHAAGNLELKLHEWDVDFAAWCTYKYLNAGPGATAAIFVHERHGRVDMKAKPPFRPRLCGWWGADKETRFRMDNNFVPRPGAAGYQFSNPSALDLSAVVASLEIFNQVSITELRRKSVHLTSYLERLLHKAHTLSSNDKLFAIITPSATDERGAQLSLRLEPILLDGVLQELDVKGVVVDERKPDVIRVAPAPLYNTYVDAWRFVQVFLGACHKAVMEKEARANRADSDLGKRSEPEVIENISGDSENRNRGSEVYAPNGI